MSIPKNIELGQIGEDLACEYLVKNKWKIISRNFRKKFGELDIIAKKAGILAFIEVKTLRQFNLKQSENQLKPEDQMTKAKIGKFKKIAQYYASLHPELVDDNKGWRLDLITLTIYNKDCIIKHYENIS